MSKKEKDQLVRDRDTFNVYRGDSESEDEDSDACSSEGQRADKEEAFES